MEKSVARDRYGDSRKRAHTSGGWAPRGRAQHARWCALCQYDCEYHDLESDMLWADGRVQGSCTADQQSEAGGAGAMSWRAGRCVRAPRGRARNEAYCILYRILSNELRERLVQITWSGVDP